MTTQPQISSQLNNATAQGWLPIFRQAARTYGIPLPVLLAVGSRETQLGSDSFVLANNWTGRDGHGKGIMQIDDRYHMIARLTEPDNHRVLIPYGAKYLKELKDQFGSLRPALSAYNAGPGDVEFALGMGWDPDRFTTGKDYAKDVLGRAELIKQVLPQPAISKAAMGSGILLLLAGGGLILNKYKERGN